jgi:hypothetical protein
MELVWGKWMWKNVGRVLEIETLNDSVLVVNVVESVAEREKGEFEVCVS